MGKEKRSFSKMIKDGVKKAVSFISNFETTAATIAIEMKYNFVVCGHIHKPQIKTIENEKGSVVYMNSGDWVENLTALEYKDGKWNLYKYNKSEFSHNETEEDKAAGNIVDKILS